MSGPIFVDLNGSTARVDPQITPTSNLRFTIVTEQEFDDNGGVSIPSSSTEIWITADNADALADALRKGRLA